MTKIFGTKPVKNERRGFYVKVRKPNTDVWVTHGYYSDEGAAEEHAVYLRGDRHELGSPEVKVETANGVEA